MFENKTLENKKFSFGPSIIIKEHSVKTMLEKVEFIMSKKESEMSIKFPKIG